MKLESKKEIKIGDIVKIRTWESMEKGFKSREAAQKRLIEIRTEKQERILSQMLDF